MELGQSPNGNFWVISKFNRLSVSGILESPRAVSRCDFESFLAPGTKGAGTEPPNSAVPGERSSSRFLVTPPTKARSPKMGTRLTELSTWTTAARLS